MFGLGLGLGSGSHPSAQSCSRAEASSSLVATAAAARESRGFIGEGLPQRGFVLGGTGLFSRENGLPQRGIHRDSRGEGLPQPWIHMDSYEGLLPAGFERSAFRTGVCGGGILPHRCAGILEGWDPI